METMATTIPEDVLGGAAVGGILGMTLGMMVAFALVWWVIQIIAYWKLFTKAGQPGWKSIIPFYNEYTAFKISWKVPIFWIYIILVVAATVLTQNAQAPDASMVMTVLAAIFSIAMLVFSFMFNVKLSRSFGHGTGFAVGLFFLWPIFILILGYGSSQYKGADL